MAAPLVLFPILPVLDDVVDGNLSPAELRKGPDEIFLGRIPLPALPEPQGPFRHDLGLPGEFPVSPDDLVIAASGDEIEVRFRFEFRPEPETALLLRSLDGGHAESDIGNVTVRFPFDPDRDLLPGL